MKILHDQAIETEWIQGFIVLRGRCSVLDRILLLCAITALSIMPTKAIQC